MQLHHLAGNVPIVLCAYIAAFLPWAASNACDFISPTWRKARKARAAGYSHLALTAVAALYLVFYIAIQVGHDPKEMFTAIAALLFALQHFLQTAWGLWQLRLFVAWASDSISALRAVGVPYHLRPRIPPRPAENERSRSRSRSRPAAKPEPEPEPERGTDVPSAHAAPPIPPVLSPDEMADELLVNDELIRNRIFHGKTRCYLQVGDAAIPTGSSVGDVFIQRVTMIARLVSMPLRCVYHAVLRRFFRHVRIPRVRQIPHEPEEVWLRWAVAFAAQGLAAWMRDFRIAARVDTDLSRAGNVQQHGNRRGEVASRVLTTGGLVLWLARCVQLGEDSAGLRPTLLRRVTESGFGLPFDARQVNVIKSAGRGYRRYAMRLSGIVQDMPVSFGREIKGFDIERVEWLAIFLHIGRQVMLKEALDARREER